MPKIRRSVYIGIGGTGIKAIANAKKMYEEIFGEDRIPSEIAFVAVDFDRAIATDTNLPTRIDRDFINLPNALNPLQIYTTMSRQGMYKWIFEKAYFRCLGRLFLKIIFVDRLWQTLQFEKYRCKVLIVAKIRIFFVECAIFAQ